MSNASTPLGLKDLHPGITVAGYHLDSVLGHGGIGIIFRATQTILGRRVALKVINPVLAGQDDLRTRFVREARAGAAVEHPNALPVYEVGDEDGLLFISMRYVDGPDLATEISRESWVDPPRAVETIRQVASALDAAHSTGLVHRDVKPHNILLATLGGGQQHAYLTDFGLARHLLDTGLTETGAALGTPSYMSPEQILGRPVDARSEVYSLGAVLFHA
jgi:serine/threonine protein kinase